MPITPLHYPIAYFVYKLKNRLSLPGLVVGSMFPDFEVPVILLFSGYRSNRLVLHSLLGAATLGTVLSIVFTFYVYPILMKAVFSVKEEHVKEKIGLSTNLVASCLLGNISHVLLDILTHQSNPIFWPLQATTISPIFTSQLSLVVHLFFGAICLVILMSHRRNTWEELLLR